jgi:hypothetical protein
VLKFININEGLVKLWATSKGSRKQLITHYIKGYAQLSAKKPKLRKWEFRNEIELTYFLKVIAGDKESLKSHKITTGSCGFHQ